MNRHFWVLVHRYAGLTIALFLILVGLTGSVLAFYHEINGWLNPHDRIAVPSDMQLLDPFELRERALELVPHARINFVDLQPKPGEAYTIMPEPRIDPATGQPYPLGFDVLLLNPYTGVEIARENTMLEKHYWPLTRENVMEFIYRLHMQLALGQIGRWLLGITALIWTIDCFIGFFLTLPVRRKGSLSLVDRVVKTFSHPQEKEDFLRYVVDGDVKKPRCFWQRWKPSWLVKWSASVFRVNFDLHRAGGLWTWIFLFIFAWSSVMFNLPQVYNPVMGLFFEMPKENLIQKLPEQPPDLPIDFHKAHTIGQRLMVEQARLHGFKVISEQSISYDPSTGLFSYAVEGDELFGKVDGTFIVFDAFKAKTVTLQMPVGQYSGNTLLNWLFALHMAKIGGLPYKILVCFMGLIITMLSITGVYIWFKKRRAAKFKHDKRASAANMSGLNN